MACVLLSAVVCSGQTPQPAFSELEEREILKGLIDRDEALLKVRELEGLLKIADEQQRLADERLRLEREQRLAEMKLRLSALTALSEYRTVRRSLFSKIITLGIRGDKRDKILEAQITDLQVEIMNFRP